MPNLLHGPRVPGNVIRNFSLAGVQMREVYGPVLTFFERLGYRQGSLTEFGYDWRNDLEVTADQLAFSIRAALKANTRRITIVAHSMGALVARCALSRHATLCEGVTQLIQIGAPVRGAVNAYAAFRTFPKFDSFLQWLNRFLEVVYTARKDRLRALHAVLKELHAAYQLLPPWEEKVIMDEHGEMHSALSPSFWGKEHQPFLSRASVIQDMIERCAYPSKNVAAYYSEASSTPAMYRVSTNGDIDEEYPGRGDGTVVGYSARKGADNLWEVRNRIDHAFLTNCDEVLKYLRRDLQ
jgi:pimeloyl-ACP methyl ester carboxylesterase